MIEIALQGIEKHYGAQVVLQNISLEIATGEKIGLLGNNGVGKTTLFRIIAGMEPWEKGERMIRKGARIGYLEQLPEYPAEYTGEQVLYSAFQDILDMQKRMRVLESCMAVEGDNPSVMGEYAQLLEALEKQDGYRIDERVDRMCRGLGIDAVMRKGIAACLSGGEKTRINMGRLLLGQPDILLLDEPTNHLDIRALEWLETFVAEYAGTVVIISHDRYFLDQTITRIIEVVPGGTEYYAGNYSWYAEEKERRFLQKWEQFQQEEKTVRRLEAAAKRLHAWGLQADNPAMHKRAFNIERRIERMERTQKPVKERALQEGFRQAGFSGKDVLVIRNLEKDYDGVPVLSGVELYLRRGDQAVLMGNNGSGKSTLLRMIMEDTELTAGSIQIGESIRVGYLPQVIRFSNPELSILDTVKREVGVEEGKARGLLARYRFRKDSVQRKVRNLSGGERSRLKLCLLMQTEVNLLLLDEPTNHLDIESREWLEEVLEEFEGTMLFVSHDRYFIQRFATRILELDEGRIEERSGEYKTYCEERRQREEGRQLFPAEKPAAEKANMRGKEPTLCAKNDGLRQDKKVAEAEKEAEAILMVMEEMEKQIMILERAMAVPEITGERMALLHEEKIRLEREHQHCYESWEKLID